MFAVATLHKLLRKNTYGEYGGCGILDDEADIVDRGDAGRKDSGKEDMIRRYRSTYLNL